MNVLIVCPIAVGPAWIKQLGFFEAGSVTPWKSQIDAARWAAAKEAAMLAKDMGTGKSITALLAIDAWLTEPSKLDLRLCVRLRPSARRAR
jgi:hypothetical protein